MKIVLKQIFYSINKKESTSYTRKKIKNKDKCVTFITQDYSLCYGVPCSGDSIFAEIEEQLYQEYPEYRETNNNFISEGNIILRFKTIDQNKIGHGKPVILVKPS